MTPSAEAKEIFRKVVEELSGAAPDLKRALRLCLHACQIMGWADSAKWFEQELGGYFPTAEVPPHRNLGTRLKWILAEPSPTSERLAVHYTANQKLNAMPTELEIYEVRASIDWILKHSSTGYVELTGKKDVLHVDRRSRFSANISQTRIIDAYVIEQARTTIEHFTFEFASKKYAQLAYGEEISNIWTAYKRLADEALNRMELGDHLISIQVGLQSSLEPDHRKVVLGCRSLLEDIATYLWKDPRPTYDLLPGQGKGKKLQVTPDKPANRLSAYLHQHGITGKRGKFLREELERLSDSISNLIAVQGEAHRAVTLDDAQAVALETFVMIGSLAKYTDLLPVTKYCEINAANSDELEERPAHPSSQPEE